MLRAALRSLLRHKLYTTLNLTGLALGVMVFLTIALIVRFETGFDASIPGGETIYRADTVWQLPGRAMEESPQAAFLPATFLHEDFPQITDVVRVANDHATIQVGGHAGAEDVAMTDPGYFALFPARVRDGDAHTPLAGTRDVAIAESTARHYFGTIHAIGRTLRIDHTKDLYTVRLVYADAPTNTTYRYGLVMRLPPEIADDESYTHWGSLRGPLFLHLSDRAALPHIAAELRHYMTRHPQTGDTPASMRKIFGNGGLVLVPLRAMHFHDAAIGMGGSSAGLIGVLGLIGAAALAIAAINYVNLATARASLRAREVAVRKVLGASRASLVVQFTGEAVVLVLLACVAGLAGCEIALHFVASLSGWPLRFDWGFCLGVAACVVAVVGVGAGIYPAFVLSGFLPAPVLAASRLPAGGRMGARLRSLLIVAQFAFATGLAICTLVMMDQARFVQNAARGVNTDAVITITSIADDSLRDRLGALMNTIGAIPGVTGVARSDIYAHNVTDSDGFELTRAPQNQQSLKWGYGTPEFLNVYGLHLIAGRWFDPARAEDFRQRGPNPGTRSIVLSATAAQRLGFARPEAAIGEVMQEAYGGRPLRVVGVIADARLLGPHEAPPALLFYGLRDDANGGTSAALHVRSRGVPEPEMMARLHAAWLTLAPEVPFAAAPAQEAFDADSRGDRQHGLLFGIGAAIAIGIACLGLYGLTLFSVSRRRHEIGIRKTLGARAQDVTMLLLVQFLRPVVLANVLAWPLAWGLMRAWLAGFDQRVALGPARFLEVSAAALLIGGLTVAHQTLQAAGRPPADALRAE